MDEKFVKLHLVVVVVNVEAKGLEPLSFDLGRHSNKTLILRLESPHNSLEQRWANFLHEGHMDICKALEQDRHLLKRKLETVRTEYDIRITELQADIRELSRSLTERESVLKQSEKEKAALITELTEQNDRLTSQLKELPPRRRKCTYFNSAPENVFTSGARGGNRHHNTSLDHDLYLQCNVPRGSHRIIVGKGGGGWNFTREGNVAVTVTPFTVGQPHQDEKQNLSHFKQFEYLPLSCLFTPTENTAHKLAWVRQSLRTRTNWNGVFALN
uniref:Uncharacterized protein n=1 Tax=Timema poppense TaxID=170557 RepID=A0A7R9H1D8_TIMPO|nr:unnamed protein product [Timema poppensis]